MITPEQREERKRFIGSSDAPAIFGADPRRSAWDLWAIKSGLVEDCDDDGNAATETGNIVEPGLIAWLEARTGRRAWRDERGTTGLRIIHPNRISAANLDAWVPGIPPEIWEAKSSGILSVWVDEQGHAHNALDLSEWGAEGTDDVPDRVKVQAWHQIGVARAWLEGGHDIDLVRVPALLGGRGPVEYHIRRDPETEAALLAAEERFAAMVRDGIPPDDAPSLAVAKRLRRVPTSVTAVPDDLVTAWAEAREARLAIEKGAKELKAAEDEAAARLIAALGTAEAGEWSCGLVTYYQTDRAGYSVEPTSYRTLRLAKPGGKKGRK